MRYFPIIPMLVVSLFTQKLTAQSNDFASSMFSKAQIEEKLKILTTPPKDTVYSVFSIEYGLVKIKEKSKIRYIPSRYCDCCCRGTPIFTRISYICPICGEETLYNFDWLYTIGKEEFIRNRSGKFEPFFFTRNDNYADIVFCIDRFQRKVKEIKNINISLDETEFCKYCSPYSPYVTKPILNLLINIDGESDTTKTQNVTCADIQLIYNFLNAPLFYKKFGDNNIERIKELFGIKY